MSGDATGFIVGCAVLAAAPYVLGVAAIGAAAYAGVKVAGAAMKAAEQHHAEHVRSSAATSAELRSLHLQIDQMLARQADMANGLRQQLASSCQADAECLQAMVQDASGTEATNRIVDQMKQRIHQGVASQVLSLQKEQQAELHRHIQEMEQLRRKTGRLNMLNKNDLQSIDAALLDAQATMETLQAHLSGADNAFRQQVELFSKQLDLARQMRSNAPQTALSMAGDIVSMGTGALLEELSRRQTRQLLQDDLSLSLTMLSERMQANRLVCFENDEGDNIQEDLAAFTQCAWNDFEVHLQDLLAKLPDLSNTELEALSGQLPVLTGRAEAIVSGASHQMVAFYRRQAAMDVLLEALADQNYEVTFAAQPDDDPTQAITANASRIDNPAQSVSITLEDAPGQALAMDVAMFGTTDESRKAHLRQMMIDRLRSHMGASASLSCSGALNDSSDRVELMDEQNIRSQPARKVNI